MMFTLAPREAMESKYRLDKGKALLYTWTASAPGDYELHAEPDGAPRGYAESYEKVQQQGRAVGTLTAPFSGIGIGRIPALNRSRSPCRPSGSTTWPTSSATLLSRRRRCSSRTSSMMNRVGAAATVRQGRTCVGPLRRHRANAGLVEGLGARELVKLFQQECSIRGGASCEKEKIARGG
jgi:hypothetical protein